MYKILTNIIKLTLAIVCFALPLIAAPAGIDGLITDASGEPIKGATVRAIGPGNTSVGTMTDESGQFELALDNSEATGCWLRISAVGFMSMELLVDQSNPFESLQISLTEQVIELSSISIAADANRPGLSSQLSKQKIIRRSKQSLLPTDPISAIREASVQRVGSNHSSKIRVHGTSPRFYMNSLPIGSDPNHYGVFSFIPAPALSQIDFYPQGSSAAYDLPSVIDLKTPNRFESHESGEFNLSVVEATGTVSVGSERAFVLGTLRKSILDKLINKLDLSADRATLPPTNFQDIMVTSGVKLSPTYRLFLDQYHVRDFLAFNTERLSDINQFNTFQHMQDNYVAVRLNRLDDHSLIRAFGSFKQSKEIYRVAPPRELEPGDLYINLSSLQREFKLGIDGEYMSGSAILKAGGSLSSKPVSRIDLRQQNWNFLPPDASSDNPFIYQIDLNNQYGQFTSDHDEKTSALFGSVEKVHGRMTIESGLRLQNYSDLKNNRAPLFRQRFEYKLSESKSMALFLGSFAESPINRILEPYQILILDQREHLNPIRTTLLNLSYRHDHAKVSLFGKNIHNRPVLVPEFGTESHIAASSSDRLRIRSEGSLKLIGGEISFETERLFDSDLKAHTFYGYTHAVKNSGGIEADYELNARHRLYGELEYPLSNTFTLGCDASVRSGLPYTRSDLLLAASSKNFYSRDYFQSYVANENDEHFPLNYSLNLHSKFDFGRTELFLNVANITNRANPIISTANGFVYDAGVMPSLGLRMKF